MKNRKILILLFLTSVLLICFLIYRFVNFYVVHYQSMDYEIDPYKYQSSTDDFPEDEYIFVVALDHDENTVEFSVVDSEHKAVTDDWYRMAAQFHPGSAGLTTATHYLQTAEERNEDDGYVWGNRWWDLYSQKSVYQRNLTRLVYAEPDHRIFNTVVVDENYGNSYYACFDTGDPADLNIIRQDNSYESIYSEGLVSSWKHIRSTTNEIIYLDREGSIVLSSENDFWSDTSAFVNGTALLHVYRNAKPLKFVYEWYYPTPVLPDGKVVVMTNEGQYICSGYQPVFDQRMEDGLLMMLDMSQSGYQSELEIGDKVYVFDLLAKSLTGPFGNWIPAIDVYEKFGFRDRMCAAKKSANFKIGFVDENGKWTIEPQYTAIASFSEDRAFVSIDGQEIILIDRTGHRISDLSFADYSEFNEGKAVVKLKGGSVVIIDSDGQILVNDLVPLEEALPYNRDLEFWEVLKIPYLYGFENNHCLVESQECWLLLNEYCEVVWSSSDVLEPAS